MSALNVDPKLSDFQRDDLSTASWAVSSKIDELEKHVEALSQTENMKRMFDKEILEWRIKIGSLQTVHTQLRNAILRKDYETRVASN